MEENQKIENNHEKIYFTMIPNIIDELGLDPYEFRLLCHYYRRGECWESTRLSSKICKMGLGKIVGSRNSLEQRGLIKIERHARYTLIKPMDVWFKNVGFYSRPDNAGIEWKYSDVMNARSLGLASDYCTYCGGRAAQLEHWVSKKNGGKSERSNYVVACIACNAEKGGLDGSEYIEFLLKDSKIVDDRNDPGSVLIENPIVHHRNNRSHKKKIVPQENDDREDRSPHEPKKNQLTNKNNPLTITLEEMIAHWHFSFPNKPKPRINTKSIRAKVKTRIKDKCFMDNWKPSLERASKSTFLRRSSWFTFGWFVKNEDNYLKMLDGNYDDDKDNHRDPQRQPQQLTDEEQWKAEDAKKTPEEARREAQATLNSERYQEKE